MSIQFAGVASFTDHTKSTRHDILRLNRRAFLLERPRLSPHIRGNDPAGKEGR